MLGSQKMILGVFAIFAATSGSLASAGQMQPQTGFFNNTDYAPTADLINSARTSVAMEIYEMDDPAVINALKAAVKRGVAVTVVQEPKPLGATCRVFDPAGAAPGSKGDQSEQDPEQPHHASGAVSCDDRKALVTEINDGGGNYVPFNKEALCPGGKGCYEHGKITVIDSSRALISSGNFNVSNLCDRAAGPVTCDRDYSYVTQDQSIVAGLESVVKADAIGTSYDLGELLPRDVAAKVTVGPLTLNSLLQFVSTARDSIEIENQYLKEKNLNAALISAAKRGVKISVMVASACSFGKPKPTEVKTLTDIFNSFDDAGISTKMFTRNMRVGGYPGYLHAKAIVIDGNRAWMGSANGSTEALSHNREFGIYFDGSDDVQKLDGILQADFANTDAESWQDSLNCAENSHK